MLSRKFYTIFSLLLIVLFIGSIWYSQKVTKDVYFEKLEILKSEGSDAVFDAVGSDSRVVTAGYLYLGAKILSGIYWIFILILALKLHVLKKISILETIFIIIFAPLAVIFYFVSLRGKLKQVEASS